MNTTDTPGYFGRSKSVDAICTCDCHEEAVCVMHCFPCCDKCYETYSPACWEAIAEVKRIVRESTQQDNSES